MTTMMMKVEELVTGKKVDDKETGSFLPEDFKNGEYEAAVRLEKQEDLKTVPEHSLARGHLDYEKENKLEAELKKKKLQARSKLENLEDLEKIIELKKKKRCKKVKVPVLKKPEPEVITGPVDIPTFFKAALENKLPVIEKYLSDKGDPNVCDKFKRTALHRACSEGHLEVVKKLVEAGAQLEQKDMEGDTPMHDAVRLNRYKIIRLLILHGADLTLKNCEGKTPMDLVLQWQNGTKEIFNSLKDNSKKNARLGAIGLNAIFASNINPLVLNGRIFNCSSKFSQAFQ
ncbi:hypothetical protein EK904_003057 [Melospiza melodia maxima]|nr:hypothetical protein EK904_003057 [Melospiza melodia maxima]